MPALKPSAIDKAGKDHWDESWARTNLPPAIDPRGRGLNHRVDRELHAYLQGIFGMARRPDCRILEIGCGNSVLLPYIAREFGFEPSGLDYSELGCRRAEESLAREQIGGTIHCEDFFAPSKQLLSRFDFVISWGVAEHFAPTERCLSAFSEFLKPGGTLVTIIPNMTGLIGALVKAADRAVYDIHVPLDLEMLACAHAAAGLDVVRAEYLMLFNLNVVNLEGRADRLWYRPAVRLRSWISKTVWIVEPLVPFVRPNRITSPYVACVATKGRPVADDRCGSA